MAYLLTLLLALLVGCGEGVVPSPAPPSGIQVEDSNSAVVVRSDAATIRIDKATVGMTLHDAHGTLLTESAAPPTLMLGSVVQPLQAVRSVRRIARGVELTCNAGDSSVLWTIEFETARAVATRLRPLSPTGASPTAASPAGVTRVVTTLRAAPAEHFYGLTERIADTRSASEIVPQAVGALDRRGTVVTMVVLPTMSLYTPFFHSSRGYGAYVEGTMPGRYDIAMTDPNAVNIEFELNPRTGEHGVVYFIGDHDAILDEYTALTGRPFLPPRWAFLHLRWRDEHRIAAPAELDGVPMNADFVNDITMYETLGIPPGSYEFDRPWTDGATDYSQPGFTSFRFDPVRFPNSDKMVAALKSRGYHVQAWVGPWALGENAVDAQRFGYYAPRSTLLIDYTNPAAAAWWIGRVQGLVDLGISGLKLDRSEFDKSELPVVPDLAADVFADGRNGREMKNAYTIDFARLHYDAFADRLGADFFNYLRAGYAGSQQYGIFWGGDTPGRDTLGVGQPTDLGLRSAILSLAHVAFMGFPIWGTDTGGYYQCGERDVFARWLEFSALCPLMEIGGGNQGGGQHAPWDMPTEPHYDAEMIDIYRRYVTLHHELVPLFDSLAREAHTSGRPLARPLVFDFPDDPAVADLWDEFLLGHDLLFAPLWQDGARSRQVYLPHGEWINYWDPTQRLSGGSTVTVDAPLDRLPMFVRAGGILPLDVSSDVTGNGSKASSGRLTIDAYPAGTSQFVLHEDAGDTTFMLSDHGCDGTTCVKLGISPSRRAYIARMLTGTPGMVRLDGSALPQAASFAELEGFGNGWFYDASLGRLWTKFSTTGGPVQLEVPGA
jgi:alpha-glucosidase (family GH31 glycosyl hydrolase)